MGKTWLYAAAVGSGIGVWVLVSAISGEREAWDSPWYLFLGMPSICAMAAVLGYIDRTGPWRWGVLPIAAQAGWMFMTQGFGNLWPLGIAFFFVLALPPTAAAYIGAVLRR